MRNVIVFSVDASAQLGYAVELGWIREVFTLSHVTPVPLAPPAIAGVVNFRGGIVSVLDLRGMRGQNARASAGESALLLEVDRCLSALRVTSIDEVSTIETEDLQDELRDSRGRQLILLSPSELFREVRRANTGNEGNSARGK